jgi:hypothetical protein
VNVRTTAVERGIPLTVLLVLLTLAQAIGVVSGVVTWQSIVSHGQTHPELPLIGAILGIVGLVAFAGVWLWRRWGVYLLTAVVVIGVLSDVWFGLPSYALLVRLVLLAALAFFIKQKWAGFR